MLEKWLDQAKNDLPVWLPDVRQALAAAPGTGRLALRLTLWNGDERQWLLPLPRWKDDDGRRFAEEYLRASVFDILSVFSGRRLTVYRDPGDGQAVELTDRLPAVFQVDEPRRTGCGKAVAIADRIGRAFDLGRFSFAFRPMEDYAPLPERTAASDRTLVPWLRRAAERAGEGLCCGVDIGGTDIKLVLARDCRLLLMRELDWDPSRSPTAEGIMTPILELIRRAVADAAPGELLDGLGVSFPDVVIRDRIVGGETPKTQGMRANEAVDYETAFGALGSLRDVLAPLCRPGVPIHLTNDGHMAAFTAAMELAHSDRADVIRPGVLAHTLGTDLGTGWLQADGSIPEMPLELYDLLLDLGSWPSRERPAEDMRSVCNKNSGLPDARRYLGQAAAFRLAYGLCPDLLEGFTQRRGDVLCIRSDPDMRKPCLERLMEAASGGRTDAEEVFRRIGFHLGQVSREAKWLMAPATDVRFLFGRFVKHPACFALLKDGCSRSAPELTLLAADEALACTPLLQDLACRGTAAVAQYAQAAEAVFYAFAAEQ